MSKKSAFQQFIEANEALLECYDNVDMDQYKGQPLAKSASVCNSQKEKVKELLRSNQLSMTTLVTERVNILKNLEQTRSIPTIPYGDSTEINKIF